MGGGVNCRLIADCRELNSHFLPKAFRLDHLQSIYPYLKKHQWAAKVNLKVASFHIMVNRELAPYIRLGVGDTCWEFRGACFGLNVLPQKFMSLMKVLEKVWRGQGILSFVNLDDILLVGETKQQVENNLRKVVQSLAAADFKINVKKSVLQPVQVVQHLGFTLNFQQGHLEISPEK